MVFWNPKNVCRPFKSGPPGYPQSSYYYDLETNLLRYPTPTAWWLSGGDGTTNVNKPATCYAICDATLTNPGQNEQRGILGGLFNMCRPQITIQTITTSVNILTNAQGIPSLTFGTEASNGITFSNTFACPTNILVGSSNFWIQIANYTQRTIMLTNGHPIDQVNSTGGPWLDNNRLDSTNPVPYLWHDTHGYPVDKPWVDLLPAYSWVLVNREEFEMYGMFKAPGDSVPVALSSVSWFWSGFAGKHTNDGSWYLQPGYRDHQ